MWENPERNWEISDLNVTVIPKLPVLLREFTSPKGKIKRKKIEDKIYTNQFLCLL